MRLLLSVLVFLLACDKRDGRTVTDTANRNSAATKPSAMPLEARAGSNASLPASIAAGGAASGSGDANDSATAELTLHCTEFDADVPIVDERPGPGVPRMATESQGLPEGSIAYESDGKIWILSSTSRRRKLLASGMGPRWFPNAHTLLFVSDLGDHLPRLFEAAVDCSSVRALTRPLLTMNPNKPMPNLAYSSGDFHYAVAPDGKHIAFTRRENDHENLYLLEVATQAERRLAEDVSGDDPVWFPDARALAYITGSGEPSELMRFELATSRATKLLTLQRGSAAIMPDSRIIFAFALGSSNTIEDRQCRLFQTDVTRGAAYPLRGSELGPGMYDHLTISPDGTQLAVSWALWTGNGPAALRDHGLALFTLPKSLPPASTRPANLMAPMAPFDSKRFAIRFTQPKTRNIAASASGERYTMDNPSWAPGSRHLAFGLAYCGKEFMDCRSQIVAVDTASVKPQPVFLANGSEPTWAPRSPAF